AGKQQRARHDPRLTRGEGGAGRRVRVPVSWANRHQGPRRRRDLLPARPSRARRDNGRRMTAWRATVLTLFPEMFPGPLGCSLAGDALVRDIWRLEAHDIRPYGIGRHRAVDDTPAGGGPGMVMRADVLAAAIDAAVRQGDARPRLLMSPRGE